MEPTEAYEQLRIFTQQLHSCAQTNTNAHPDISVKIADFLKENFNVLMTHAMGDPQHLETYQTLKLAASELTSSDSPSTGANETIKTITHTITQTSKLNQIIRDLKQFVEGQRIDPPDLNEAFSIGQFIIQDELLELIKSSRSAVMDLMKNAQQKLSNRSKRRRTESATSQLTDGQLLCRVRLHLFLSGINPKSIDFMTAKQQLISEFEREYQETINKGLSRLIAILKTPLTRTELSNSDLEMLFPYLSYVDLTGSEYDPVWISQRIQSGTELHTLIVQSDTIVELILPDSVRVLQCNNSPHLRKINLPKKIEQISLIDCPQLTSLSMDGDPKEHYLLCVQTIRCYQCPQLGIPPRVPGTASIETDLREDLFTTFRVYPEEIEQNPLATLNRLARQDLIHRKPFPNMLWIDPESGRPSPVVDAGGLKKQLVTDLAKNLFSQESPLSLQGQTGSMTPTLKEPKIGKIFTTEQEQQSEAFKALGLLLAYCFMTSLSLGPVLDPKVFYGIAALSPEQIDTVEEDRPLPKDVEKTIFCAFKGYSPNVIEDDVSDYVEQEPIAYPIALIAKAMKFLLAWDFSNIPGEEKNLILAVQGQEVSPTLLKSKTEYSGTASQEDQERIKGFFEKWIDDHPDKLADLLEVVTSRRSLDSSTYTLKMTINSERNTKRLPDIHTCFNRIDFSALPDQKTFNDQLNLVLKNPLDFQVE